MPGSYFNLDPRESQAMILVPCRLPEGRPPQGEGGARLAKMGIGNGKMPVV